MATSLSSALALAALVQAPGPPPPVAPTTPPDSLTELRVRAGRDSTDAQIWLLMGRAYLELGAEAHGATHRASEDSAWTRAVGDSARVLRVGAWAARSWLAWEAAGLEAGQQSLGPLPTDLRVPAVLEELGENLLRACPTGGVLLTAGPADSYAAWYMRFARNLRPDLVVVPFAAWDSDRLLRGRLATDLKLGRGADDDGWLVELVRRRPVCVSMAFEQPPSARPRIKWETRPLEWVAGPEGKSPRVPPRDFVFAALRVALDRHDPWAEPALAAYARAARTTPALCEPLATFNVATEVAPCRR